MASEFTHLLDGLVERFGSRDALGKAIQMSGSRVGRAMNGQHTFNILSCLRLADATGESPSAILRAAGKTEVADLIEKLYGQSRPALDRQTRDLVDNYERVSPDGKELVRRLVAEFSRRPEPQRQQPPRRDRRHTA